MWERTTTMTPSYEGQSLFINTTFATKVGVRWSLGDRPKTTARQCNRSTGTQAQPSLYNNVAKVVNSIGCMSQGGGRNAGVILAWMRTLTLTIWKWTSQQQIFASSKDEYTQWRDGAEGSMETELEFFNKTACTRSRKGGAGRRHIGFSAQQAFSGSVWRSIPSMSASQSFANDAYLRGIIGRNQSFMADRYSTVVINPQASEFFTGTIGLPQRSPISPIRKSLPSRQAVEGLWTPWHGLPVLWDL